METPKYSPQYEIDEEGRFIMIKGPLGEIITMLEEIHQQIRPNEDRGVIKTRLAAELPTMEDYERGEIDLGTYKESMDQDSYWRPQLTFGRYRITFDVNLFEKYGPEGKFIARYFANDDWQYQNNFPKIKETFQRALKALAARQG